MTLKEVYEAYIAGDHWAQYRKDKAKVEPRKCMACLSTVELHCHHMIYRTPLEFVLPDDTCWLCRICHERLHVVTKIPMPGVAYNMLRPETVRLVLTGKPVVLQPKKLTKAQRKKEMKRKQHQAKQAKAWRAKCIDKEHRNMQAALNVKPSVTFDKVVVVNPKQRAEA